MLTLAALSVLARTGLFLAEGQGSYGGGCRDQAKEDTVSKAIHRAGRMAGAVAAATLLAGCGLSSIGGSQGAPATGPPVTITKHVAPSALMAVVTGRTFGPALSGLVTGTAQPNEDVRILECRAVGHDHRRVRLPGAVADRHARSTGGPGQRPDGLPDWPVRAGG